MKKLLLLLLITLGASSNACAEDLIDLIKGDYTAKADSMEHCFIENFMDKTKGTFWSTPKNVENSSQYIYWQQAHAIDVIIYAFNRLKETDTDKANTYRTYIRSWVSNYANNYHGRTFENPYTDDMVWIGLTLTHIAEALGSQAYYRLAKNLYDQHIITRAIVDDKGFRLPWNWDKNDDGTYKDQNGNACTNGPAALLSAILYQKYGDESYLDNAIALYDYMIANICKSDGRVEEPPLTYTQGAFGEACRLLYHITGKAQYRTKAYLYISYAFNNGRCTNNGLLRHEGESMDQSIFKSVLIPYACNFVLDEKMMKSQRKAILKKMQTNAEALAENLDWEQYPNMYCPYYWGEAYDYNSGKYASMGAMTSGASLFENVARMQLGIIKAHEEALGIENITNEGNSRYDNTTYNLAGQKVADSYKGIVIRNNKKYINR